jgi:hypothetical protein
LTPGKDQLILVPALSDKGFYHEYFLFLPETLIPDSTPYILVVPNNSSFVSENHQDHFDVAQLHMSEEFYFTHMSRELGVPLIYPVFDRPEFGNKIYTHALDRGTLDISKGWLKRIDMQLLAMVDYTRSMLNEAGIEIQEKIIMYGFSASSGFSSNFANLHPFL